jgi:hypothetical protein
MSNITKILFIAVVLLSSGISFATQTLQISSTTTPSSITPGNDGYVTLTISNVGTSYTDTLKIRSARVDSPIIIKSTLYQDSLGSLGPSKAISTVIRFEVPSGTPSGFYSMEFIIEACDSSSLCSDFAQNAVITVQASSTLEISSVKPTAFSAGEATTMNLTLINHGSSAISDITLSWTDINGNIIPLGSDNRKFIASVAGNSQINVPIDIIVNPDATPGVYSISVNMGYNDMTGTKNSINSSVGLMITGYFNFVVTTDSQDIIVPGTSGSINIKIANGGSQDAELMVMGILESNLDITPSVIYIGKIKSDDYDTEKLTLIAGKSVAPGIYKISMTLDYKDIFGNSYNETKTTDIVISSPEATGTKGDGTWIIVLLILIVIGYLAYRKLKKR